MAVLAAFLAAAAAGVGVLAEKKGKDRNGWIRREGGREGRGRRKREEAGGGRRRVEEGFDEEEVVEEERKGEGGGGG